MCTSRPYECITNDILIFILRRKLKGKLNATIKHIRIGYQIVEKKIVAWLCTQLFSAIRA